MGRRATAVGCLLAFALLTGVAVLVASGRPPSRPGVAPALAQGAGYLAALVAGTLLFRPAQSPDRRRGVVVLGTLSALAVVDLVAEPTDVGADLVRMLCLVVIGVVTARLAVEVATERRDGPGR